MHYSHNYKILKKDSLKVLYHSIQPGCNSACFAHITNEINLTNTYIDVYCFKQLELLPEWLKMINKLLNIKVFIKVFDSKDNHIPANTSWNKKNDTKTDEYSYTVVRLDCDKAKTKEAVLMYLILLRPFCTNAEKQEIPSNYFKLREEFPKSFSNYFCLYFAGLIGRNGNLSNNSSHWIFSYNIQTLYKTSKFKELLFSASPLAGIKKKQIAHLTGNTTVATTDIQKLLKMEVTAEPSYALHGSIYQEIVKLIKKKDFKTLKKLIE